MEKIKEFNSNNAYHDTLKIPIWVIESDRWVASITKPKELSGCTIQAENKDDIQGKLMGCVESMLKYYKESDRVGRQRSIWRSHGSKKPRTFWFTIIGIGLHFHIISKEYMKLKREMWMKGSKYNLRMGRLSVRVINYWKRLPQNKES